MAQKILIADDDPIIIKLLQVNLEMEGYEVVAAQDGQDAVEKAKKEKPDLAILDLMMPRMDGFTARKTLLEDPDTKEIPVVFLSARAQQADLKKGLEHDVVDYITKPFDPSDLIDIVAKILAGTYERPSTEEEA